MELGNSKMKNFNPIPYKVVYDATQKFDSWYESYITGYNMPGDLSDALNSCHPNFIIHSTVRVFLPFPFLTFIFNNIKIHNFEKYCKNVYYKCLTMMN